METTRTKGTTRLCVELDEDEALVVARALNEVCNGISIREFELRLGAPRDEVHAMLHQLNATLRG